MPIQIRRVLPFVLLLAAAHCGVQAATLRFASAFDPQTMDPHALALQYQTRVVSQIYEGLVDRDRAFKLEPALATGWQQRDAKTWRFQLRQNATFHDGTPFAADDVVFSIERALAKTSQRANQMRGIVGAKKVDAHTVDVTSAEPDAVLPEKLYLVLMMSKAWCEAHGVQQPQDYNGKQETYAVRQANGTGPFKLVAYESDVRTTLVANPTWWGRGTPQGGGNLDGAVYTVIQSDATRLAALQSNQVDMVIDPPTQDLPRLKADPSLKLMTMPDIGLQYLALDQHSESLPGVPGRNPFKDVRVRRAIALAIDTDLIAKQIFRGQAQSAGAYLSPRVTSQAARYDTRAPADPARARALLKEAGYAQGFPVTLDCVNVAWRVAACQAVASMLDKVGLKVTLRSSVSSVFFPKLTQADGSFFEFGWSPAGDPWVSLNALVRTKDGQSGGTFNAGRYSNPKLDALLDAVRVEPDLARREQRVGEAFALMADELPLLPLYRRFHNWAMRPTVDAVQWPNDVLELRWVRMR